MNPHDFENQLQQTPLRPIPPGWRDSILRNPSQARISMPASASASSSTPCAGRQPWYAWLTAALWPHPTAWAALVALWVVAFGFDRKAGRSVLELGSARIPSQVAILAALPHHQALLSELRDLDPAAPPPPSAAPGTPGPRSQRRELRPRLTAQQLA